MKVAEHKEINEERENYVNSKLNLGVFDLWALGITAVIGGQYFSWNTGLSAGFGSYLISTVLVGTSYICLCFCNAEITSALPFAGGAYGIARASLGLYPGYIIGCLEIAEYIAYVAAACIILSRVICQVTATSLQYIPLYSLVFYIISVAIQIHGGRLFWRSNAVLGVVSISILLMYNFSSLHWTNTDNFVAPSTTGAQEHAYFIGGFWKFISVTPISAWLFVGVESLNLSCPFVSKPRIMVGKASILCAFTLFATSVLTLVVSSSLPPITLDTDLASGLYPLNDGFMRALNISYNAASVLSIPATFATAFGFIYGYGRVILSMSRSGLFPPIMMSTYGVYKTPHAAIIVGSLIGYALVLISNYIPSIQQYLFNVLILSAYTGYASQLIGFILFRIRYPDQERHYLSPLGILGAVYPFLIFLLSTISVIAFQNDNCIAFFIYLGIIAFCTVFYFAYSRSRQCFSIEEQFIFVQQIVKFNERGRKLACKGRKQRGQSSISSISSIGSFNVYGGMMSNRSVKAGSVQGSSKKSKVGVASKRSKVNKIEVKENQNNSDYLKNSCNSSSKGSIGNCPYSKSEITVSLCDIGNPNPMSEYEHSEYVHGQYVHGMHNSPRDAFRDLPRETICDARGEATRDTSRDTIFDTPRDDLHDTPRDAFRDTPRSTVRETPRDAGRDTGRDTSRSTLRDTPRDSTRDTSRDSTRGSRDRSPLRDTSRDILRDTPRSTTRETPRDTLRSTSRDRDTLHDTPRDIHYDMPRDAFRHPPRSTVRETPRDTFHDASRSTPRESIRDTPRSPIRDTSRDILRDTPRSTVRDTPRSTIRGTPRDSVRDTSRSPTRDTPRSTVRDTSRDAVQDAFRDTPRARSTSREKFRDDPIEDFCDTPRYAFRDGGDAIRDTPRDTLRSTSKDAVPDTSRSPMRDTPRSTVRDTPRDSSGDTSRDSNRDSTRDRSPMRDTSRDILRDTPRSTVRETPRSTIRGTPRDTLRSTSRDSFRDTSKSTARDTTRDTLRSTSRDTIYDAPQDTVRSTPRGTVREMPLDTYRDTTRDILRSTSRDVVEDKCLDDYWETRRDKRFEEKAE